MSKDLEEVVLTSVYSLFGLVISRPSTTSIVDDPSSLLQRRSSTLYHGRCVSAITSVYQNCQATATNGDTSDTSST